MMKLYIFSLACLLLVLLPSDAQASYWIKCEVNAKVMSVGEGTYQIKVLSGKVLDGHANKDSECLSSGATYDAELSQENLEKGDEIDLLYEHYNSRAPHGVMESTTWKLAP